jgi:hypothetical protein
MSKKHRVAAELKRIAKLPLNYKYEQYDSPGHTTFAFEDGYTADVIGQFLKMALQGYRRPVLIHNGRKPR